MLISIALGSPCKRLQTTHASCCYLGGLQTAYRTGLRVWASVVKLPFTPSNE